MIPPSPSPGEDNLLRHRTVAQNVCKCLLRAGRQRKYVKLTSGRLSKTGRCMTICKGSANALLQPNVTIWDQGPHVSRSCVCVQCQKMFQLLLNTMSPNFQCRCLNFLKIFNQSRTNKIYLWTIAHQFTASDRRKNISQPSRKWCKHNCGFKG